MAAAAATLFPVLGYFAVMSTDIVPFVMGEQWRSTAGVAAVVAATACLSVFTYFDRAMFAIVDRMNVEIALVTGIVLLHLVVTVLVAPSVQDQWRIMQANGGKGGSFTLDTNAIHLPSGDHVTPDAPVDNPVSDRVLGVLMPTTVTSRAPS